MKKLDFIDRYGEEAWERQKTLAKENYKKNAEKRKRQSKKYREEHTEKYQKYRDEHKEEKHQWYLQHSEEYKATGESKRSTKKGRAQNLLCGYRRNDRNRNMGECTITSDWIVDNILNRCCVYCGESDWTKLGADRIDNSKPHTPDNVVCSCWKCNNERGQRYSFEEFIELKKKKQNSR